MTAAPAIEIKAVSKAYRIWQSPAARLTAPLYDRIGSTLLRGTPAGTLLRRRAAAAYRDFWALRDISFTVPQGESLGIIGLNGSGKSTLLQIIAGTLQPTSGTVQVHGRVAALLELGSGFNPDFTGRENVYLNGAVLGLTRHEIDERFAAIADFADIGDFIEQPVRTYSTGMAVRLAFAVLTQVRPDVLIVDEALAVGDFLFQQKCYDVIRSFRRSGCTFLFVSHGMGTVLDLCDRALLLQAGQAQFHGPAEDAVNLYEATALRSRFQNSADIQVRNSHSSGDGTQIALQTVSPNAARESERVAAPVSFQGETGSIVTGLVDLVGAEFLDEHRHPKDLFSSGSRVTAQLTFILHRALDDPHVGFKLRDGLGRIIFETSSYCMKRRIGPLPAGARLAAEFAFDLSVIEGEYSLTVGFANGGLGEHDYREVMLYLQGVRTLQVVRNRRDILWSGIAHLRPSLSCRLLPTPAV
jgi:lipopolysaccharide transport system ATP-binding protein